MNGLLITNVDNTKSKSYAIYYTNEERFYVIYTEKEKDENGYVILHIAKVLKEVNSTPDGIVPTGKFIGLEISDPNEWDSAKMDISAIVANKQSNTPINVKYLDVKDINEINIKSSKIFKLREDVVNSIIVEEEVLKETPISPIVEESILPNIAPVTEPVAPIAPAEPVSSFQTEMPTMAPNPFAFGSLPVAEPVREEVAPTSVNPYDEIVKERDEAMISALANDSMQDIVPEPAIPVSSLSESREIEMPTLDDISSITNNSESSFEFNSAPIANEFTDLVNSEEQQPEVEPEIQSSESFVDSIVADVSDIVDNNDDDDSNYERLYKDELEKTTELEKELKELHSKLNNIKNIVE